MLSKEELRAILRESLDTTIQEVNRGTRKNYISMKFLLSVVIRHLYLGQTVLTIVHGKG